MSQKNVVSGLHLIELSVNKLKAREGLHDDGQDDFHRIFSESFACAHPLASEERHEAHGMVLCSFTKSLGLVLVMVGAPLILQMLQFGDIAEQMVACSDSELANLNRFGDRET